MVRHDRSSKRGPSVSVILISHQIFPNPRNFLHHLNSSDASALPPTSSYSRGGTPDPAGSTGYMFRECPGSILLCNVLLRVPETPSTWVYSTTRGSMLFMLHHSRS